MSRRSPGRLLRILLSCSLIGSVCLAAAGCGGQGVTGAQQPAASTVVSTDETREVTIFRLNDDATALVAKRLLGPPSPARVKSALTALASAPTPNGLLPALPAGTTVVAVALAGDEARVELSTEFTQGYPRGGAAAELAVVAPLVYTATNVPGIARVRVLVAGEAPRLPGSQFDWSAPLSRADLPALQILEPSS